MLQVHHGFYSAYYNTTLRHEILKSVQWAWKTYGNLPINVVGHSMGGALASFCALDLSVSIVSSLHLHVLLYLDMHDYFSVVVMKAHAELIFSVFQTIAEILFWSKLFYTSHQPVHLHGLFQGTHDIYEIYNYLSS
jgi:acetyl esterase/lipase